MSKSKKEKKKEKELVKKTQGLWAEFKAFITRGNILDMAVGVIIGGAFNAIVTALVNILMSVCTWGVPGGIKGLITVLPASNPAQAGVANIGQKFDASTLNEMVIKYAHESGATITVESDSFVQWKNSLLGLYQLHGTTYVYNQSAFIDWGTFINAIISFLIIALTLFVIVKVSKYITKKRDEYKAKMQEEYYQRHPEERPVPPAPAPKKPTTEELLISILSELQKQNGTKPTEESK